MKFKILILLILCNTFCFGQIKKHHYTGILQLKNNQPISFSLELTEKDGNVFGYSITNQNTEDETKSEVQGLYFKKDKTFQLQETQIITTKSEAPINLSLIHI